MKQGTHFKQKPDISKEVLKELYTQQKRSQKDIADRFGCTQTTISHKMNKFGLKPRTIGEANRALFEIGKRQYKPHLNESGYVMTHDPEKVGHYVREHRKIMEQKLGRKLKRNEIVHHLNGIRNDNRQENLTKVLRGEHGTWTYVQRLQRRIRVLERTQK